MKNEVGIGTILISKPFIEDKRFYNHFGLDIKGIVRAIFYNININWWLGFVLNIRS